jgi:hypothetical protein
VQTGQTPHKEKHFVLLVLMFAVIAYSEEHLKKAKSPINFRLVKFNDIKFEQ